MVINRCLLFGVLTFLTALAAGGAPIMSGTASYGPGSDSSSASQWRVFCAPRELNMSTINHLKSPILCGMPFACLLNVVAVMVLVLGAVVYLKTRPAGRSKVIAGTGAAILVLWLVYDLRETYSQFKMLNDFHRSYVMPSPGNEPLPYLGNFYRFVGLCRKSIPPDGQFHFYSEPDWPYDCRSHYFLYPRRMISRAYGSNVINTKAVPYHVVYNAPYIQYDPGESRLYSRGPRGTYFVSKAGRIVAEFDRNSFIFLEGNASQ